MDMPRRSGWPSNSAHRWKSSSSPENGTHLRRAIPSPLEELQPKPQSLWSVPASVCCSVSNYRSSVSVALYVLGQCYWKHPPPIDDQIFFKGIWTKKLPQFCFWLFFGSRRRWDRWHIIPQVAVYTTYILPSGGIYATYHLLREPETTIEILKHIVSELITKYYFLEASFPFAVTSFSYILLMEENLHHLGFIKPRKYRDKLPTSTRWPDFFHQR